MRWHGLSRRPHVANELHVDVLERVLERLHASHIASRDPEPLYDFALVGRRNNDAHSARRTLDYPAQLLDDGVHVSRQSIGKDLDPIRNREQFAHCAGPDYSAGIDNDGAIANLFYLRKKMRTQKDGLARRFQCEDQIAHFLPSRWIEPGGGLVH